MADLITHSHGIFGIDGQAPFGKLQSAVHVIVEGGRAAIVDPAANAAVPHILEGLAQIGVEARSVDYVVLTHVHLDHAGGAGLLMRHLPNARLAVHPRGAKHIADPAKLVAGTIAVYGRERAREMYGDVVPVPAARILETPHDAIIALNGRELRFLDTPGHARHHVCIVDSRSGHVFAGDTFGLSYRELDVDGRQFVFPSTTPVQFDPPQLHRSIDMILECDPQAVYVMHFGQVREVRRLGADLHRLVDAHEQLGRETCALGERRHAALRSGMEEMVFAEALRQGWRLDTAALRSLFANDIELNAQGIGVWLDSVRR